MFGYRSRGHLPNNQMNEQRQQTADLIDATYEVAIAYWSVEHDCCAYDYTVEQLDRLQALRVASGDARVAKHLIYGQTIYDLGRINEWGEELP